MVYLDNAASTPMLPEIKDFYFQAMDDFYANPHAGHALARTCSQAADHAKNQILKAAKAKTFGTNSTIAVAINIESETNVSFLL